MEEGDITRKVKPRKKTGMLCGRKNLPERREDEKVKGVGGAMELTGGCVNELS